MFTVYFHHATTTPPQPGLGQLVEAALADCGAERTGLEAEVRLGDGALFYLFGEDDNGQMLAEYPKLSSSVPEVLLAILRRTNSFLLDAPDTPTFLRSTGAAGEPRGSSAFGVEILEVDSADALAAFLDDFPDSKTSVRPIQSRPRDAKRGSSLMDFLFGKPG